MIIDKKGSSFFAFRLLPAVAHGLALALRFSSVAGSATNAQQKTADTPQSVPNRSLRIRVKSQGNEEKKKGIGSRRGVKRDFKQIDQLCRAPLVPHIYLLPFAYYVQYLVVLVVVFTQDKIIPFYLFQIKSARPAFLKILASTPHSMHEYAFSSKMLFSYPEIEKFPQISLTA